MTPQHQLTDREIEILQLLAEGLCNQQIANQLCITIRTVKFHTNNIYTKLAVNSRSQAIAWAWKHQLIQTLLED
jgi:two-component system, NarL family, response regulator LiaR